MSESQSFRILTTQGRKLLYTNFILHIARALLQKHIADTYRGNNETFSIAHFRCRPRGGGPWTDALHR